MGFVAEAGCGRSAGLDFGVGRCCSEEEEGCWWEEEVN